MKKIKCGKCGHVSEVENPELGTCCQSCGAEIISKNAKITDKCAFCGEEIRPHEAEIFCPGCGTEYHADCWLDHDGCGTDGCEYVDYLAPMEIPTTSKTPSPVVKEMPAAKSEEVEPANQNLKAGEDFFEIKNAPANPARNKTDEAKLIRESKEKFEKRNEMPEQPKISFADMKSWFNTPRDTKYDFDGKWYKDPYLFQKAKNYVIFLFGGIIGGAILGVSLAVIMLMFKYMFFHTGLSYATLCFFFFVGLIAGIVCALYVAYRTMATLIDN
ncbi:MAG: hypothetical protein IJQ31_12510 [Thermoguttaceae bacterium]|nr:hypothetical protein [Thermoguttaceae bacterium]